MFRLALLAAFVLPMGPPWVKLDDALAAAASSGKLVAVYATMPASGDRGGDHGSPEADEALASKAVAARYGEYHWARAADKATAKRIDAPEGGSHLVFVDPEGRSVGAWSVQLGGEPAVIRAMDEAKELWKPSPVPWVDAEPDEKGELAQKRLILYAFLDDKEASEKSIKALEHPWVARDHNRVIFVRKYVLDGDLAKRFKVTSAPTFVFYDAAAKAGQEVIERKTGELTPKVIRAPMRKFFERALKRAREGK